MDRWNVRISQWKVSKVESSAQEMEEAGEESSSLTL